MNTNMLRRLSRSTVNTMFLSGSATSHPSRCGVHQADLELFPEPADRVSASCMPMGRREATC